ncbi:MAG: hypothetical protein ACKO68_04540, partial [Bacteroidota bacterium]
MFKIILIAFFYFLSLTSFGQAEYRDSILFKNGSGILCKVMDITDDVVFFEQENTAIVLSASLTEVREIRWDAISTKISANEETRSLPQDVIQPNIPPDSVEVSKQSPAYQQGKKDAFTYYRKRHKYNYNNFNNPNNKRLIEPEYYAGYRDGASEKKAAMVVVAASTVVSLIIIGVIALAAAV